MIQAGGRRKAHKPSRNAVMFVLACGTGELILTFFFPTDILACHNNVVLSLGSFSSECSVLTFKGMLR